MVVAPKITYIVSVSTNGHAITKYNRVINVLTVSHVLTTIDNDASYVKGAFSSTQIMLSKI